MTPYRTVNYATWAIWGAVTLYALHHTGWVRAYYIEGGEGIPLAFEFFEGCYGGNRYFRLLVPPRLSLEMLMVPANLVLIGLAMAVPLSRLRASVAAYTLFTVFLTIWLSGEPRIYCWFEEIANRPIHSYKYREGITTFDMISLVARFLYLALFFSAPLKWTRSIRWSRNAPATRVNEPMWL